MKKECHCQALNSTFLAVYTTSTLLVNSGVCSAAEVDTALVHFCRLVVASGGFSGLLCGIVGGGSVDSSHELTTDIYMGLPIAWGAVAINWVLPRGLAKIALYIWQKMCWPLKYFRGIVARFVRWWTASFYARFERSWADRAKSHAKALEIVCNMERNPFNSTMSE